jgi:hypothetical protein
VTLPIKEEELEEAFVHKKELTISPNPFQHFPQITSGDEAWNEGLELTVFSIQGKRLLQLHGDLETINEALANMNSLNSGVFFIQVQNGVERKSFKVVKR